MLFSSILCFLCIWILIYFHLIFESTLIRYAPGGLPNKGPAAALTNSHSTNEIQA